MKLISADGPGPTLSAATMARGDNLSLVHFSKWRSDPDTSLAGCFSESTEAEKVIRTVLDQNCASFLQASAQNFENDVCAWISLRENAESYFCEPLQTLLSQGTDFSQMALKDTRDKAKAREQISNFAMTHSNQSGTEAALIVFEELYMNAMIDAQREAGAVGQASLGCQFFWGIDQDRLGISCQDPYGSLDIKKFLRRIQAVQVRDTDKVDVQNKPGGGAGLGGTMLLAQSSLLCLGVKPGKSSVVSCLIPRHLGVRQRDGIKKSLHLVEIEEQATGRRTNGKV